METRIRALKPATHVLNDWRGGQVWAINGASTTLRLQAEAHINADYTIATALLPTGASVGCPIVARVSGASVASYVVEDVRGGVFARGDAPRDEAASVAAGVFTPSVITPNEGADWGEWPWTANGG